MGIEVKPRRPLFLHKCPERIVDTDSNNQGHQADEQLAANYYLENGISLEDAKKIRARVKVGTVLPIPLKTKDFGCYPIGFIL